MFIFLMFFFFNRLLDAVPIEQVRTSLPNVSIIFSTPGRKKKARELLKKLNYSFKLFEEIEQKHLSNTNIAVSEVIRC